MVLENLDIYFLYDLDERIIINSLFIFPSLTIAIVLQCLL